MIPALNKILKSQAGTVCCRLVFSYCGAAGIAHYYFYGNNLVRQSILNVVLCALIYLLLQKTATVPRRTKKLSCIAGIVYATITVVGKAVYDTHGLVTLYQTPSRVMVTLFTLVGLSVVISSFLALILNYLERLSQSDKGLVKNTKYNTATLFFILWGVIFVMYIPYLLAYYPGVYSYDMKMQTAQALGRTPFTKYHPPLHTFLWKLCLKFSGVFHLQAVTLYALLQMLVVSAFFACFCCYVKRINQRVFIGSVVWFALNPVLALFAMIPTKDVLFSVFFGWTLLLLHHALNSGKRFFKSPIKVGALVLCVLFSCLFRNNAIYVFIVAVPIYLLFFKGCRLRITAVLSAALALLLIINGPIMQALKVRKGNDRELFSVPIQQIALTVVRHEAELSPQEISEIDCFLDFHRIKQIYNPRFADPVKSTYRAEMNGKGKKDFVRLWLKLGLKYPKEYIVAFLDLNIPYWFMDADSVDPCSQRMYIETTVGTNEFYSVQRHSKLPWFYQLCEKVADYSAFRKIPVLSNVFSISTPVWVILFCALCLILKKKYQSLLNLVLPFLLWGTYLLGPVSNFRYVLPLFMLYPFFALLIARQKKTEIDRTEKQISRSDHAAEIP